MPRKGANLADIAVEESSQAQRNTHCDSLFIKNRKSPSRGAAIRKGLEGGSCNTYRISMKRQRGHTLSKTRHCGEMGGFSGRRGAPHRGTGKLDVEGLGAPKQGTTLPFCKVQQKG